MAYVCAFDMEEILCSRKRNGITLIALIVTIVILLILVGVVVNFSIGENGLIGKARDSSR